MLIAATLTSAIAAPIEGMPHDCLRGQTVFRPKPPNATSVVSKTWPIRVWFDPGHANSAAIVDDVLAAMELSWAVQVDEIGFNPPILPDNVDGDEFDVYLLEYYPLAAFVAADWVPDPIVGDGYNSQPSYMVIDYRMPANFVDSYIAHEFNHACQWGYDFSESTYPIWEATATAAEKWTLGEDYNWARPVYSFQEVPYQPTLVGFGWSIWGDVMQGYYFEYGAAMWVVWLDEIYGDAMGSAGVELWEEAANEGLDQEPDVVDAFAAVTGSSVALGLAEFAVARYLTGIDWDERGIDGADAWGDERAVPAEFFTAKDLPLIDHTPLLPPYVTGQAFFDVALDVGDLPAVAGDETLWAVVESDSVLGQGTGLTAMWWSTDDTVGDAVAEGTAPSIEVPLADLDRLVVAISNTGPAGWEGDDDPYVPGDQQLTITLEVRGPTTETTPTVDTGTPGPTTSEPEVDPGEPGGPAEPVEGCGCTSGAATPGAGVGLLLLFGLVGRRRLVRG